MACSIAGSDGTDGRLPADTARSAAPATSLSDEGPGAGQTNRYSPDPNVLHAEARRLQSFYEANTDREEARQRRLRQLMAELTEFLLVEVPASNRHSKA